MAKVNSGFEKHSQFFEMEITIPTQQDVDEIVKQVLEELKDFHPASITGTSVVMSEVLRRLKDKVTGSFTIKPV